jgi:uncharacterized protein YndB with AHSA1/START domain
MRILKISGLIFGFLLVIFFLLGVFVPDFEYENSVTIHADRQTCWNNFHDVSKMKMWMEGFESLTLKSGAPLQQGSRYEVVFVGDGERMVMDETITAVKPPEMVSYDLNNDVLNSVFTFSFQSVNEHQTTIHSNYKVTGKNLLWRSILFLSKSYFIETGQKQLDDLKKMIENP